MADPQFTAYAGVSSGILQPNMTRMRHRFKGARESFKFNLESHQTYYDIVQLRALAEQIGLVFDVCMSILYNYDSSYLDVQAYDEDMLTLIDFHIDSDSATPDTTEGIIESLFDITTMNTMLASIEDRIDHLVVSWEQYPSEDLNPSPILYPGI